MKRILVLEDTLVRVQWLRRLVGDSAEVVHAMNVADFLDAFRGDEWLIILDHDLGHAKAGEMRLNYDVDGKCGMDAARALGPGCSVIVWSVNPVQAPRMVEVLEAGGRVSIWIPFWQDEVLAHAIRGVLG